MVQAYILIQTEVGKASTVAELIGKIPGVIQAEDVTGPYDVSCARKRTPSTNWVAWWSPRSSKWTASRAP